MLIRLFSAGHGDYKKILERRRILFGALSVLGFATVGAAIVLGILDVTGNDFILGFYAGVGGGVAGGCLCGFISTRRLMKNREKMRAEEIKETDERGKEVTLRALSTTGLLLIICAYVALMVFALVNLTVFYTLFVVIVLFFVFFLSSHAYFNQKL